MKILKYSGQREAIKKFLISRSDHPTADIVYDNVRKEFPNISLGTVYRNLNLLVELNQANKITVHDGSDRFDAILSPHYHFICNNCGCVKDINMPRIETVNELASKNVEDFISDHEITFYGTCKKCLLKNKGIK